MSRAGQPVPLWALISCGLAIVASLYGLAERHRAEAANRAVGLAVEHQLLADLASVSGISEVQAVRMAKAAGFNGLVIPEDTVADKQAEGILTLASGRGATEVSGPPSVLNRLLQLGELRLGRSLAGGSPGKPFVRHTGSIAQLRATSLGLDPASAQIARAEGMEVIARHSNSQGASARYVKGMLRSSAMMGAKWMLPSGDSVLGRRSSIKDTADALREFGMVYLTPEFVKISGDDLLRSRNKDLTLRLHSIQAAEADRLSESAYIERFAKAYRERSIRWLMLRPISAAEENPLKAFLDLAAKTKKAVEKEGGSIKTPRPFSGPDLPRLYFPVLFLLAAPFLAWVGAALIPSRWSLAVFALAAGALAAGALLESARPYCALIAAMAFPTGAYLWLEAQEKVTAWKAFAVLLVVSLAGGLMVSAALVGVEWTLQNEQFTGIKLAHFLPIGLAGLILLRRHISLGELTRQPILYGTAAAGLTALAVVYFMLARTGNDNPAAVSGIELQFRSLLEAVLYARPRTKEFLIGHPALVMGLACMAWSGGKGRLGALGSVLTAAGAIGLTSMVNTLCHLHTPIDLGLARIGTGLVIGGILGLFGAGILSLTLRKSWAEEDTGAI